MAPMPFQPAPSFTTPAFAAPQTFFAPAAVTSQKMDLATLAKLTNEQDMPLLDTPGMSSTRRLYDQNSFRNWNIQMSQRDIDAMNANPIAEQKFPCSITSAYGSRTAKTFATPSLTCRYKGAVGSLRMCVDQFNRLNGKCRKLSWAVDVDGIKLPKTNSTKKAGTTIHGAKNLIFGGSPADWSMMSERMAYALLNAVNVTAPLASHSKLFLNGRFLGVYSFVQPVDTTFTRERFIGDKNNGKGALYKQVWFNRFGMMNLVKERKGGSPEDDMYMRTIMATIDITPLTQDAAARMFSQYFDTKSFIDVTALDAIIGATDDWRQRHNFLWYVRSGSTGKKLVLIPWDYDRLYDKMALTRGALAGIPWWDFQSSAKCNAPLQTPEQMAAGAATSQSDIPRWTAIFNSLPTDSQVPVSCDKITKLLSLAFGAQVRARTKEFLNFITLEQMRSWFATWNAQIELALAYDPDGPNTFKLHDEQNKLLSHLSQARDLALNQANAGDRLPASFSPAFSPLFRNG
jgi:hypothetical protein